MDLLVNFAIAGNSQHAALEKADVQVWSRSPVRRFFAFEHQSRPCGSRRFLFRKRAGHHSLLQCSPYEQQASF